MKKVHGLSKSRIGAFLQCPKRLWLEVHHPELREDSAATQSVFAAGHQVGDLARTEYPEGILIGHDTDLSAALKQTQAIFARRARKPVFEATFQHAGVLIRADLMLPVRQGWHMAEVKSAGEAKPYHLNDLAIQTWVARNAGVKVARATVRHIDKTFIYQGKNNYRGLLMDAEVDHTLNELLPDVPAWVDGARSTLNALEPQRRMGAHCNSPFACPFLSHCESLAGPQPAYPVTLLPGQGGKKLARELGTEGYVDLRKVPARRIEDAKLKRIHKATVSGTPYRDITGARNAIAAWAYPRAFLDFETIGFTVPIWKSTHPFEQTPFQWSCHIEDGNGRTRHCEFLDLSGNNPARACAEQLVTDIAGCGTVIAYNASFERGVINRLAEQFPDLRGKLLLIAGRIQDLLPVVRNHYYHRDMLGSFSIKAVLPTLAPELDYAKLGEVQDGDGAQQAYLEAIDKSTTLVRKNKLKEALRGYCRLDSLAMVTSARSLSK